jgi:predicted DNA-binding transcriptional regulator AlpA
MARERAKPRRQPGARRGRTSTPEERAGKTIFRIEDVVAETGMSRPGIYDAMRRGDFPKCFKLTEHGSAVGWVADQVRQRMAERIAAAEAD